MEDLLRWLLLQKGGAGTFAQFRQRALALRFVEPECAAAARLLADLAGRFADSYDEEALPIELSQRVLKRLIGLVENVVRLKRGDAGEQLAVLNQIGVAELID